jgi:transposase
MKEASEEIRSLVVKASLAQGATHRQLAEIVGYHVNTIGRWIRECREKEKLTASPRGHRLSMFSEEEKRQMAELIDKTPDITLREIRAHFGKTCSLPAIFKHVKNLGYVFEKNAESQRTKPGRYRGTPGNMAGISEGS